MIYRILVSLLLLVFTFVSYACAQEVKVIKQKDGSWQLLADGKHYFIKGVVFSPVKIGESPDDATVHNWMDYDNDHDDRNDIAFKTWADKNHNNHKDLGINTIREYHVASDNPILGDIYKTNPSTALQFDRPVNKPLLRQLFYGYGIRVIMGNFLGSWTVGSGASWDEGTDYTNPKHIENIKKSVKAMVLDNKDEPYVLMWELGNENNIAEWSHCNAKQYPQAYAKLIGELAHMVHQLDPRHPVAASLGDAGIMNQAMLKLFAQYAPEVDIVDFNAYRGPYGFGSIWKEVKKCFDRPVLIAEFGTGAYNAQKSEDQVWQDKYIRGCWKDIVLNSSDYYDPNDQTKASGNSIGGVIFDWVDRWYMDGSPSIHNAGSKPGNSRDGMDHEEWFGIMSMGDGSDTLMRQERKICTFLKETWTKDKPAF